MVNILFVITILSIVSFLFFQELYQLITIYTRTRTQFGTYALSTDTETSAEIPTLFDNIRKDLIINQTTLLVGFLKFWHILFILVYLVFTTLRYFETKQINYGMHSSILYNFNYILVFNTCYLLYYYRKLLYFFIEIPSTFYGLTNITEGITIYLKCIFFLV